MGPGARRRLSAEQRRESILAAACAVFGERGYELARIDDVAVAAGISKALIYEHFSSKEELYAELMGRSADDWLECIVRAAFAFVHDRPNDFQMFLRDVTNPPIAARQVALRARAVSALADLMDTEPRELHAGLGRRELEMLAEIMVGAWYALAGWWLANPDVPVEQLVNMLLGVIWLGLEGMRAGRRWDFRAPVEGDGIPRNDSDAPVEGGGGQRKDSGAGGE